MYKTFKEVEEAVLARGRRVKLALAASADDIALDAVIRAQRNGIIEAQMVGDAAKTKELLKDLGENPGDYDITDEPDPLKAIRISVVPFLLEVSTISMTGLPKSA